MKILGLAILLAALGPQPTDLRFHLFLAQDSDPDTARQALACWAGLPAPKEAHLAVSDYRTLEADLLRWAPTMPAGLELPLWDPQVPTLLRRFRIARLPCFVAVGSRVHRIYGVPARDFAEEVHRCRR